MAKKKTNEKVPGTALRSKADIDAELAKYAVAGVSKIKQGEGTSISIKGGKFSLNGGVVGKELEVIILDSVYLRTWYSGAYDPENTSPPACWMISDEETEDTGPDSQSAVPQSDSCSMCEKNEWGSSEKGKGKACGSHFRLAIIDGTACTPDDIEAAEVPRLTIPTTTVANWKSYVVKLAKQLGKPPFAVVTKLTFDLEADWEKLQFSTISVIDDPLLIDAILRKREDIEDQLRQGYDKASYATAIASAKSPKTGKLVEKAARKTIAGKKFAAPKAASVDTQEEVPKQKKKKLSR